MRTRWSGLCAVFALMSVLTSGCKPVQQASSGAAAPSAAVLPDSHWVVATMDGVAGIPANSLSLDIAASSINGRDGCNSFTGPVSHTDSSFKLTGPLAGTAMSCPDASEQFATEYRARLQRIARYRLSDSRLELADASGKVLIVLQPGAASPVGGTWDAVFYNNGQNAAVSVMAGTRITAEFGTDGRITGNAGCNNYFASYTIEGDSIKIGAPGATRKACADPAGILTQESQYLQALATASSFRLSGNRLELRNANGSLLAAFERSGP